MDDRPRKREQEVWAPESIWRQNEFRTKKTKNIRVNGTTTHAVIVGPKCLIAHLLAPHDRGFSPLLALTGPLLCTALRLVGRIC